MRVVLPFLQQLGNVVDADAVERRVMPPPENGNVRNLVPPPPSGHSRRKALPTPSRFELI
jgi:hypothetical protein